jgi:hypothetical protein
MNTRSILECGGKRSATPLLPRTGTEANEENEGRLLRILGCLLLITAAQKRRRRRALPARSNMRFACNAARRKPEF